MINRKMYVPLQHCDVEGIELTTNVHPCFPRMTLIDLALRPLQSFRRRYGFDTSGRMDWLLFWHWD